MAGGWTDAWETSILNHELRSTAYTLPTTGAFGYFTVTPVDAGTGGTEVSGNAYARQAYNPALGQWSAPTTGSTQNAAAITFPVATPAGQGRVFSLGYFDATGGTVLRHIIPLVTSAYQPFEMVDTVGGVFTARSHGFAAGDAVRLFPVPTLTNAALPTGVATDTQYFVRTAGLTADAFTLSTTGAAGTLIVPTTTGAGEVAKDGSFNVVANSQLTFAINSITLTLD